MKSIVLSLIFFFSTSCSWNLFAQKRMVKHKTLQEMVIPMDMSTYRPIVEVLIDGKGPYRFIFDTGSTTHVMDTKLSEDLGLKIVGEEALRTPGSESRMMSKTVAVPRVSFPGTNISKDIEMSTIPLREMLSVDGIIGGFFVEEYMATMDYPGSKLILSSGELNPSDKGVLSFIQNPRTLNLYIDVDGNRVEAHLDTGNPTAITLPYSLKDKLKFKDGPHKGIPMRTPVASFESWNARLDGTIKIGDIIYKDPEVNLAEGFPTANVGYGTFHELKTTIDRKNSLIRFEKVENLPPKINRKKLHGQKVSASSEPHAIYIGEYEGDRMVLLDKSGELAYQRAGMPVSMKLVELEADLYEMKTPEGVYNPREVPKVYFIRNKEKEITAIQFIYKERKDGPFKKLE